MPLSKEKLEQQKKERLEEIGKNKFGTEMKIVEYNGRSDIIVEFQDSHKGRVHTQYSNFKKGEVKNPYDKTVFGVGYVGVGKYKTSENGKLTKVYNTWQSMLQRCYDPYFLDKHPTYRDCIVCDEWHNFQNFAKWYYENVYNCNNERLHLDKDILVKGNKIYSPDTCVLVPHRINVLFVSQNRNRGKYPIGMSEWYDKRNGHKWLKVRCNIIYEDNRKCLKNLGRFPLNRPFQAFYTYKIFKENYIKQVADEYKDLIPNKLYEAMYKYEVEIND